MMQVNERLVCFLYILLRDHLPSGKVEGIMAEHVDKASEFKKVYFSNPHVEAHAREVAARLCGLATYPSEIVDADEGRVVKVR